MVSLVCFSDLMVTQKSKGATRLEKIEALVNWARLEYRLTKILNRSGLGPTGYNPLQLFKILVLQNLYGLSDPQMEEMLYDRLSFRRFCHFSLSDSLPDETTICRFRNALQGHSTKLFALVMGDLSSKGIILKSGSIVDATVISSSVRFPEGGAVSPNDPEAGWTKKGGQFIYGYKAHIATDVETGLIKRVIATSADVHDSQVFGNLLSGNEPTVYADKAYDSAKNRCFLKDREIQDCIMHKGTRASKPSEAMISLNKLWGRTRSAVERVFAHLKGGMNLKKSRYKGWDRHQVHFDLVAIAYNLRQAVRRQQLATG